MISHCFERRKPSWMTRSTLSSSSSSSSSAPLPALMCVSFVVLLVLQALVYGCDSSRAGLAFADASPLPSVSSLPPSIMHFRALDDFLVTMRASVTAPASYGRNWEKVFWVVYFRSSAPSSLGTPYHSFLNDVFVQFPALISEEANNTCNGCVRVAIVDTLEDFQREFAATDIAFLFNRTAATRNSHSQMDDVMDDIEKLLKDKERYHKGFRTNPFFPVVLYISQDGAKKYFPPTMEALKVRLSNPVPHQQKPLRSEIEKEVRDFPPRAVHTPTALANSVKILMQHTSSSFAQYMVLENKKNADKDRKKEGKDKKTDADSVAKGEDAGIDILDEDKPDVEQQDALRVLNTIRQRQADMRDPSWLKKKTPEERMRLRPMDYMAGLSPSERVDAIRKLYAVGSDAKDHEEKLAEENRRKESGEASTSNNNNNNQGVKKTAADKKTQQQQQQQQKEAPKKVTKKTEDDEFDGRDDL